MKKQELKKMLADKRGHLVDLTLEAMRESVTMSVRNSWRTDVIIDMDDGQVSSHFLTSPSETLRGVFEGYMLVVTSVSMSDISDWANEYFAEADIPDEGEAIEVYLDEYTSDLEEAADMAVEQGIGELLHYWQE